MASRIVLDIFSGRPNPEWVLTEAEEEELARRLAALPPAPPGRRAPPAPALGYRGLRVLGGQREVVLFQGVQQRAPGQAWDDPSRELERWLLETGRSKLPAGQRSIIDAIRLP